MIKVKLEKQKLATACKMDRVGWPENWLRGGWQEMRPCSGSWFLPWAALPSISPLGPRAPTSLMWQVPVSHPPYAQDLVT